MIRNRTLQTAGTWLLLSLFVLTFTGAETIHHSLAHGHLSRSSSDLRAGSNGGNPVAEQASTNRASDKCPICTFFAHLQLQCNADGSVTPLPHHVHIHNRRCRGDVPRFSIAEHFTPRGPPTLADYPSQG